ncbi:MAG: hypothetical protein JXA24_00075 [Proteobacteria bacterium]|nr:hypothetical protein [Pseudomonadota bacterium]
MKMTRALPALALALLVLAFPSASGAQSIQTDIPEKITLSSKVPVSFYGFVLGEFLYSDSQLSSFGTFNNTPASYNTSITGFNRVQDETAQGNNDAYISATVQNTRFGFMLAPYDFGGRNFKVNADIEMDFFSTANLSASSISPRLRRAYAGIGQRRWHVLMGQEWDIFSPLNPATFNVGANLWNQGNLGFRRPQIRFTFKQPFGENSGMEAAVSAGLPSNSLSSNDPANTTGIPMGQARLGLWHDMPAGKLWAYISGVYYRNRNAVAGAADINNWGLCASILAPVHKFFQPSVEFQYGYSLGSLLSGSSNTTRQRTVEGWGQVKSKWLSWLETNAGYGGEFIKGSQVPAGWVKSNQLVFANIYFKPLKDFVVGPEYNYMRTNYQGSGASEANVVFLNAMYYF